ncbi:gamma-glutamyltranspeptidase/glutathione hydrolase [Stella humosa]|uniref:Glutathione hydrolase proenzyme n=1 Tax=Stella humosa TaxID=94 RepID=A0A3N1MH89_9PROT|nr:gamma-glutamyltransferase [Stella humosa]ROQ02000.1 gamma-glutamyltranspeptidase/glutathione hydrolase [Stella humosa]
MKGIVVCPQPRAADVGADVLRRGGTAFDAAIATAFAQMVADPFMCGLGGMGTLQFFRAEDGASGMIDFHTRAGSGVWPDMWTADMRGRTEVSGYTIFDDLRSDIGYRAIMTPGTVAGLWEAHRRLCSRPWAELVRPAAAMARDGLEVTPFVHDFWARPPMPGVADGLRRIRASAASASIFLHPEGRLWRVGEVLRNPDLATTLEALAEGGADLFYRGEMAARMAVDLAANGAYVTAEDLAGYAVRHGAPVEGRYRGFRVLSNPPPGSGVSLIQMLHILEHFPLGGFEHGSPHHLDLVARAMAAAHLDREEWLGDPDFADVPVEMLTGAERAAEWAGRIRGGEFPAPAPAAPPSCTTHLSVHDEAGNAVSLTHTLGTGAGVVTPGLGFVWNNSMKLADPVPGRPNSLAPGKARTTGMVPTILLRDGQPFLVVGAPGGSVIISSVLQTILNVVDFGMSPVEAVSAPRIHCEGGPILAEARIEAATVRELVAMGHKVRHSPISYDPQQSRAHAIVIEGGVARGGADPRGGGGVARA